MKSKPKWSYVFADGYAETSDEKLTEERLQAAVRVHGGILHMSMITPRAQQPKQTAPEEEAEARKAAEEEEAPIKQPAALPPAIASLLTLRDQRRDLKEQEDVTCQKIKSFMVRNQIATLQGDTWQAEVKDSIVTRFDRRRFKKDHPKMYAAYITRTTRKTLSIHTTDVEEEDSKGK